jgi:hypothetical protein
MVMVGEIKEKNPPAKKTAVGALQAGMDGPQILVAGTMIKDGEQIKHLGANPR